MHGPRMFFYIALTSSMWHSLSADFARFFHDGPDIATVDWIRWKLAFNKVYYTYEEEAEKFMIFFENREKVRIQNDAFMNGVVTYGADWMNPFTDLTAAQFEVKMSGAKFVEPRGTHKVPVPPSVPESVDWRERGFVTSVKNQDDCNCSTCFAAAGVLEAVHCKRHRGILSTLSAQQILDCAPEQNCCIGGSLESALEYAKTQNIMHSIFNDWKREQTSCRVDDMFAFSPIRGYNILEAGNEENLMNAVALIGPIAVNFKFSSELQFYSNGVFYDPLCEENSPHTTHIDALIVGYGTDETHGPYWLVKFSWGTEWGEDGYIRMTRMGNHCAIANAPMYPYF